MLVAGFTRWYVASHAVSIPGHLPQIYGRHEWGFYHDVTQNYGTVVKLQGMFGVSQHP